MALPIITSKTREFFDDPAIDDVLAESSLAGAVVSVFGDGIYDHDKEEILSRITSEEKTSRVADGVVKLFRRGHDNPKL